MRRAFPPDAAPARRAVPKATMILGLLISAAVAAFGLMVALGLIGHPIDAQLVSPYGWSILLIGLALMVFFAYNLYRQARRRRRSV